MLRRVSTFGRSSPRCVPFSGPTPSVALIKARIQAAPTVQPGDLTVPGTCLAQNGRLIDVSPNVFLAADSAQLMELSNRFNLAGAELGYTTLDLYETQFAHESEHAEAAQELGAFVGYGLRFAWHPSTDGTKLGGQLFVSCSGDLTRLENAAIIAAPRELSPDDLRRLQGLGFSSQQQVAAAIVANNRKRRAPQLPLPKPFQHLGTSAAQISS